MAGALPTPEPAPPRPHPLQGAFPAGPHMLPRRAWAGRALAGAIAPARARPAQAPSSRNRSRRRLSAGRRRHPQQACKAGDGTAGRRLTFSDARVGYRLSGFRPGLVPVLRRASARGRPPSVIGSSPPWPRPQPCTTIVSVARSILRFVASSKLRAFSFWSRLDRCRLDVRRNGPKERGDFACDRRDHHGGLLAFCNKPPVAGAKTSLRLPGNGTDLFGQVRLS